MLRRSKSAEGSHTADLSQRVSANICFLKTSRKSTVDMVNLRAISHRGVMVS